MGRSAVSLFGRYVMLPDRPSVFECRPCKINFKEKEELVKHVKKHREYRQSEGARLAATFD